MSPGRSWHPAAATGFDASLSIDFPNTAIGRQAVSLRLTPQTFRTELADARTFTLAEEVARLRAAGLAQGGSLANAVVVDGPAVLNPGGLRRPDEFVRHKMLDVVGDLALAGAPLRGRFTGHRSGHALNNRLLRALFADRANWRACRPVPRWRRRHADAAAAAAQSPDPGVSARPVDRRGSVLERDRRRDPARLASACARRPGRPVLLAQPAALPQRRGTPATGP